MQVKLTDVAGDLLLSDIKVSCYSGAYDSPRITRHNKTSYSCVNAEQSLSRRGFSLILVRSFHVAAHNQWMFLSRSTRKIRNWCGDPSEVFKTWACNLICRRCTSNTMNALLCNHGSRLALL